jgi:hypothetical protein
MLSRLCAFVIVLCVSGSPGLAQSINLDFDVVPFIPGYDPPSSAFAGAAVQAGLWNSILGLPRAAPLTLKNLQGLSTSARVQVLGRAGLNGDDDPGTAGDRGRLLDDYIELSLDRPLELVFTGLERGRYHVYTYAVVPNAPDLVAIVGVVRSIEEYQTCGGPIPMDGFALGITHVVHRVEVQTGQQLRVLFDYPPGSDVAGFNGMQIVRVGPACPGDFDHSGTLDVLDLFDYLAAWFAGNPRTDVNTLPGPDVLDIFDFLASWFEGCRA